ncbi:UNVERIFIED_CONTAM: hypothetical protein GTU68_035256 [Idotea baltica]|nr:hypothetical protein [Idotea baltica]
MQCTWFLCATCIYFEVSASEDFVGKEAPPGIEIEVYSHVYPILVGKASNPVTRINIHLSAGTSTNRISEFSIQSLSTVNPNGIEACQVFYVGSESEFREGKIFGKSESVHSSTRIQGDVQLKSGDNYFWIACTLRTDVDVLGRISLGCDRVKIGNEWIELDKRKSLIQKRIGLALRKHGDEGIHTYRIPGLATSNSGTLIAVYDNRRNGSLDLQEDVDIGMSRSTDGGDTWEPMRVIMDMGEWGGKPEGENGIGDPSILVDRNTNTIWVAAIWAHGHPGKRNWFASKPGMKPAETSQLMIAKSEDDGKTWSAPINITPQIKDPAWHLVLQGPGKGITRRDGTLVFPAQYKDHEEIPHSTLIYSQDGGETWTIGTGAKSRTTEAQVVELQDGSLMLNMRDDRGKGPNGQTGKGARSVSITTDMGKTWKEHPTSGEALPEPVCMASLIRHGSLLLFSNPADTYERERMTIKISRDEGMTWPEEYHTLIYEGNGRGYSCMTMIDEETVGILYESDLADMVFQKFKLGELLGE